MFQNFKAKPLGAGEPPQPTATPADQARSLIARYPQLSEWELARLINLYRALPAVDVALMLSDEQLGPKMDLFSANHRSKIRPPFRHYAALIGYAVLAVIGVVWAASVAA